MAALAGGGSLWTVFRTPHLVATWKKKKKTTPKNNLKDGHEKNITTSSRLESCKKWWSVSNGRFCVFCSTNCESWPGLVLQTNGSIFGRGTNRKIFLFARTQTPTHTHSHNLNSLIKWPKNPLAWSGWANLAPAWHAATTTTTTTTSTSKGISPRTVFGFAGLLRFIYSVCETFRLCRLHTEGKHTTTLRANNRCGAGFEY